jgi:penicillin-binding protein 1C
VRTALASSLNVPAVRTLNLVGLDRFHDTLLALRFDTLTQPDDYYGSALALGGAEVTLLALTNAYRALANGGVAGGTRLRVDAQPAEARRVYGRAASFIVTDILADRGARATTFGLDNPLATRVWSAAKTGTSKDMRDNWCIGYTSRYTIGVWVGNFSGAPMRDVSGVSGAAPIWRDLVHWLHREETSARPAVPDGVAQRAVTFEPAAEAQRREWFVAGTAMTKVRASSLRDDDDGPGTSGNTPRIRYPAPGTIIALDPDIPAAHQRVAFSASPAAPDLRWRLGDTELTDRHGRVLWAPTPGRHTLVLEDAQGAVLSRVDFEVRGR